MSLLRIGMNSTHFFLYPRRSEAESFIFIYKASKALCKKPSPMAATARSEARRRAILARGNDRLAKLTASARGKEATVYPHDGDLDRVSLCIAFC